MSLKKQTPAEVLQDQGEGKETEENVVLPFPNPPAEPEQEVSWEEEERNFDWLNDPSVILRDQAGIAAHYNKFGELVVRQRDTLGSSAAIFIAPENIETFLKGLRDRAKRGTDE